ncbi:1,3-beta-glucanase [Nostocoides sp. F2B08]|uniref:glycosyl hydrolase n=1 Tax=Nostocoides sp. F2B08 TaxID=2653936 RepID=UPI001262F6E9|nr:glycosyl hydrolase [Tetrasphaera sp. F2B08]KAB7744061.1 1,3-beta-glucanase [Tetrasphaera sp. F2B08]
MRRGLLASTGVLAGSAILLSACGSPAGDSDSTGSDSAGPETTTSDPARAERTERDLAGIPTVTGPYSGRIAVTDGVNPPTNSWVSPAVFAPEDRPIFTGVLSARLAADAVTLGLPDPVTDADVVMAPHPDHVALDLPADDYELGRLDAVSARFDYSRDGEAVGELTLAEGWPYAQYVAASEQRVGLPDGAETGPEGLSLTVAETTYRIVPGAGAAVEEGALTLEAGSSVHVYAEPAGATPGELDLLRSGAVVLESTEVTPDVGDDVATTTLTYRTAGDADTVLAVAPRKEVTGSEQLSGAYETVLGDVPLVAGTQVTTSAPLQEPVTELDLDGLDDGERSEVETLLETDVASMRFDAPDSYHGGKQLQRAANLFLLASGLGRDDLAEQVRDPLAEQLDLWFDAEGCTGRSERCFTYDDRLGGLVGQTPAYGSDEFNDHHFHYGHMLYAAGVLASAEPELVDRWRAVADLAALDFGSPEAVGVFPQHRVFDEWRGHSWASGPAPFADGNNQESSSEAVNAWVGLSLWARATGDEALADHAAWLLSQETTSALDYWIDPEVDEAFGQPVVSLNWQGKRDFATFFSAEPSAIVGIQLIPMNPTQLDYLAERPEAVQALSDAVPAQGPGAPLADYVVLARALVDPQGAAEALAAYGPDDVDGGTSLSYATALVLSREG